MEEDNLHLKEISVSKGGNIVIKSVRIAYYVFGVRRWISGKCHVIPYRKV